MKNLRVEVAYRAAMGQLRNYIEKNELKPGDRLPTELTLAQNMGISRGTVREALKALEALGIVETRRGEGMFLQAFSFKTVLRNIPVALVFGPLELLELLQVRKALECQFIKQVASNLSETKLANLKEYLGEMLQCVAENDAVRNSEIDYLFHNELYFDQENELLLELIDTFVRFMNEAGVGVSTATDLEANYQVHLELVSALEAKDGIKSSQCMAKHFSYAEQRVREYIEYQEKYRLDQDVKETAK